jgi:hypothetical protein
VGFAFFLGPTPFTRALLKCAPYLQPRSGALEERREGAEVKAQDLEVLSQLIQKKKRKRGSGGSIGDFLCRTLMQEGVNKSET